MAEEAHEWYEQVLDASHAIRASTAWLSGDEGGLMWNGPAIGAQWPALPSDAEFDPEKLILSEEDQAHPPFKR